MKHAIITGANGFIGSSLVKKLISKDIKVLAIDCSFTFDKLPKSELLTKIETEIDDAEILISKIPKDSYDIFYHLAWAGVNGSLKTDPIVQLKNAEMAITCAKVAKQINCKKFLCAGTIAEQAVKSLPNLKKTSGGMLYSAAKYATRIILEAYCKNIDLNYVWMQFSNIYGPTNKTGNLVSYTIGELVKEKEATFGPAEQIYDFIYVEDLLEAIYRLGEYKTKNNFYFIGSGTPQKLKQYLNEIGRIFGKPELIKIGVRPDDGIKYTLDMFDIGSLKDDIGEYVSTSFEEGIKHTIEYY